jgi:hypothetical protein
MSQLSLSSIWEIQRSQCSPSLHTCCWHRSYTLFHSERFWHLNSPLLQYERFTDFIWLPTDTHYAEFSETLSRSKISVVAIYIPPCLKYFSYFCIYLKDGSGFQLPPTTPHRPLGKLIPTPIYFPKFSELLSFFTVPLSWICRQKICHETLTNEPNNR